MLDWQVREEEEPLASDSGEDPPSRPAKRYRNWRVFGGLLLLLMVVGLFVFRWRLDERTKAMKDDLKVFIRHEEQQRVFGLREQVDKLMVPDAPKEWQEAYRSIFVKADEVLPVELEVDEIELDGTNAFVAVRLDEVPQVRFYQLVEQKWRRAPLSDEFWGEERYVYLARQGMTISYRARDEAFVQNLATELPLLLQQWPMKKGIRRIQITPQEFGPALLEVEETQLTLNSPNLLIQGHTDGERAVRLQLADRLLAKTNSDSERESPRLPGATPFLAAIRMTFILSWALPDEAIPRQIWHQVAALWKSPFLGQWQVNREELLLESVWQPRLSDATALLMADYLYDQYGREGLEQVMKELPTAPSWDRIFYPLTGHYTVELEDALLSTNSAVKTEENNVPQLPFDVTLLDMDLENGVLDFEIKDRADKEAQLSVKVDESTLSGLQRTISPGQCAALHKQLTITEADWLTMGQELQARQLVVSRSSPSISLPADRTLAPPDTFAYLAEQRIDREGNLRLHRFIALSEEGTATHLTTLPPLMSLGRQIPSKTSGRTRFLLTLSAPECDEVWLFMYDPRRGILSRWFTSFSESSVLQDFVWNPLEGEVLLTGSTIHQNGPAAPRASQQVRAEFSSARYPLSWHSNQAVILNGKSGTVKLIDVALGEVAKIIPLASEHAHLFMLSEDETRLFYAHGLRPAEKQSFHMLDFESGQDSVLFSTSTDEWLKPVIGGISTDHVLLLKASQKAGQPITTQLLLVGTSPGEPTVVIETAADEFVTSALACEDDRVLMTIYRKRETEVRMWRPDSGTKSLFKADKPLQLLSCR